MNTVELVVLATTKVGENAVVVHTLSREYGRRGFMVRPGKKQGMALFLPLNILEADVVENPKSTLWSLRNILLAQGRPVRHPRQPAQKYHDAVPVGGAVPHRPGGRF